MTRDRIVVGVILVVVAIAVVVRHIVTPTTALVFAVAIPSIILHEVSHGVAALSFGDDTAKKAGRITLNPIPHIDLLGTLILPALLAVSGLAVFGYAKPVPVNPSRMRHPANDAVWVSLTGPVTNLLLALAAAAWLRFERPAFLAFGSGPWSMRIPLAFGFINIVLAVFNLVPIPPLDGSAVVGRFMPEKWLPGWYQVRRYGVIVLLLVVLVKPAWINDVLAPFENWWVRLVAG
ncbi:MAG: site-2 protease family protein [Acidimicrobiales bacterium]